MQSMTRSKCVGILILFVAWHLCCIIAQPGFLSIDCGGNSNRTDSETGIAWVTDENYMVDSGSKVEINDSAVPFYLRSARVFRKPINKTCYELPLIPNVPHVLRMWFFVGTFNGLQQIPRFDFSIETVDMLFSLSVPVRNASEPLKGERILVTSGKVVYFCLIRNSEDDDLFISAIELRAMEKSMYDVAKPGQMLRLIKRYDVGAKSMVRYPQDRFDRLWYSLSMEGAQNVTLEETISTNNTKNLVPSAVMQTAAATNNDSMYFSLEQFSIPPTTTSFHLFLYFAEIESLNGSESSTFHVLINNNETPVANISLERDFSAREVALVSVNPQLSFRLLKASSSNGGPLINGFEQYQLISTETATSSIDATALAAVNQGFNIKNWISDPCFVLPWEGIQCTNISSTVRVSEIELSGRYLSGVIPPNFAQLTELVYISLDNNNLTGALPNLSRLTKLERLYLQNNSLRGRVPEWLSQLHNLKELDIRNNNFSGVIPQQLLDQRSLKINYSGNYYLCMNRGECLPSSHSNSNGIRVIIGVIVSGIVMIGLSFFIGIVVYRKRKLKRKTTGIPDFSMVLVPNTLKSHAFSLEELIKATENFSHNIGQGGFGSVFWGKLRDEKQIAVKVLSLFSKQGVKQFLNEIDLLSRVHHRKLVSLLGYCNESRDLMLVYEYMPGGSLDHYLYGHNAPKYPELDWKTRLKIALDAAQGLEYLHIGCTPKIIHRDVKTANILLDNNLNGKLADFGLSRVARDEEASHVFTGVRGTAGYLDPKYFSTHMLTEKSDVYSFGVVLLEIISDRRAVDLAQSEDKVDLVKWVTPYVEQVEDFVEILDIVDKRLLNDYTMKSINKVAKLAIKCIAAEPTCRPSINEVVEEMREALKYDNENNATNSDDVSAEIAIENCD